MWNTYLPERHPFPCGFLAGIERNNGDRATTKLLNRLPERTREVREILEVKSNQKVVRSNHAVTMPLATHFSRRGAGSMRVDPRQNAACVIMRAFA